MAGRYCDLNEAKDTYLAFYKRKGIDPSRQAAAEAAGDGFIDTLLSKWDRSTWTVNSMPQDAQTAATMFAAGEFIIMEHAATNPNGAPEGLALQDRARQMMSNVVSQGFLIGQDGQPIRSTTGGNGLNVGIGW